MQKCNYVTFLKISKMKCLYVILSLSTNKEKARSNYQLQIEGYVVKNDIVCLCL